MTRSLRFPIVAVLLLAAPPAMSAARFGAPLHVDGANPRTLAGAGVTAPALDRIVPLPTVGPGEPAALGFPWPIIDIEVSVAGDVDANGSSDWLRGTPNFTPGVGLDAAGRVAVLRRDATGDVIAQLDLDGPAAFAYFGTSVAALGDINGDGYDEIAVGAPGINGFAGRVYIFRGSATGTQPNAPWTIDGTPGEFFGYALSYAGDVNGDGYDDILIGGPGYSEKLQGLGAVRCFLGGPGGPSPMPARTWIGEQAFEFLGWDVAGGGDVNADGYADVMIGSPGWSNPEPEEGRARLFLGGPGGPAGSAAMTYEANFGGDQAGKAVCLPGDMNGDGYGEIALGVPDSDEANIDDGRLLVFGGGPFTFFLPLLIDFPFGEQNAQFGFDVAPGGDLNGDGFADLMASAPFSGASDDDGGVFTLYGGPHFWLVSSFTFLPGNPASFTGLSLSGGGDRGDGDTDFLVGFNILPPFAGTPPDQVLGDPPGPNFFYENGITFDEIGYIPFREFAQGSGLETGFGVSSAVLDLNGDGYDDVVVGNSEFSGDLSGQGVVRAFHGSDKGLAGPPPIFLAPGLPGEPAGGGYVPPGLVAPDWEFVGPLEDANFSFSVANGGDINGDGYEDLLVGAPTASPDSTWEGAAYLFYGGPDGLATQPDWVAEGQNEFAVFGYHVAGAGDVNQDGHADFLIGAPFASPGGVAQAGIVSLYYGSVNGPGHVPVRTWAGRNVEANAGTGSCGVGDVNGDGFPDILVNEPGFTSGEEKEGGFRVYTGSAAGVSELPFWSVESNIAQAQMGLTCAPAGDFDGDGYADILAGSPFYTDTALEEGGVWLYRGLPGLVSYDGILTAGVAGAHFGLAVSSGGDIDKDGDSEIWIGAPDYNIAGPVSKLPAAQSTLSSVERVLAMGGGNAGAAFLWKGQAGGVQAIPTFVFDAGSSGQVGGTGRGVASGDINGDGWPDLVWTTPYDDGIKVTDNGSASIALSNVVTEGLARPFRVLRSDGTTPIADGGHGDSPNSFRLSALGRHPMGRGRARLQWQAKPLGAALDGTGTQSSSVLRTGVPDDDLGSTATYTGLATGLSAGTDYRVRTRYATRHPFYPRTRWFTSERNAVRQADLRTFGPTGAVAVDDPVAVTGALSFAGPWPNPLAGTGTLSFTLPAAGRVTIDAYDANGRRVARVHDGEAVAGPSSVTWNARDDAGRALPRGLYFLRLKTGAGEKTVKAVLAR